MRYLSVCSGIEAATVAWHHMGWQPVAFSDIEPFPSAVLAHHYPHVPNLGDMTKFEEWNLESVDLLVGGTPCQSFSVAGLRKGLADPRGNLMLTFLAIAQRQRPRWIVWENVPGVLSSNGGRDFGTFLGALGELGYGFAYRVLDAQWFGVAQRRRRVFVVGCLGDWQRPAQVLFERESVRRDTAPSREKGQEVAGTFKARANSGGWCQDVDLAAGGYMRCYSGNVEASVAATLETTSHDYSRADGFNMVTQPITFSTPAIGDIREDDVSSTITKNTGAGGETQNPAFVAQPITFGAKMSTPQTDVDLVQTLQAENPMAVAFAQNQLGEVRISNIAGTINTNSNASGRNTPMVAQPVHYRKSRRAQSTTDHETWVEDDATNTLNCFDVGDVRATDVVAQPVAFDSYNLCETGDITQTIKSPQGGVTESVGAVMTAMQVRRLTPVECERLQGFPDNYTNIPWRKKPESPDGPRYKALGNSMAVPVMRWIGERIKEVSK